MTNRRTPRPWALGLVVAFCAQVLVVGAGSLGAAPGERDTTFGPVASNGLVRTHLGGHEGGRAMLALPDGKLIVAGSANGAFTNAPGDFLLLRYHANGVPDATFGTAGKVITDLGGKEKAKALVRRPNGNLVVAGVSCGADDNCNVAVVGYLPNGSLDPAFGTNGVVTTDLGGPRDLANAVALQPDGKVVVAGRRGFLPRESTQDRIEGDDDFAVLRYSASGILDATFRGSAPILEQQGVILADFGGDGDQAHDVLVHPNGNILVAGAYCDTRFSKNAYTPGVEDIQPCATGGYALARFTAAGDPDPSFGVGGRVVTIFGHQSYAIALAAQADGKLVVGGYSCPSRDPDRPPEVFPNLSCDFSLARYTANGELDTLFGTLGVTTTDFNPTPFDLLGENEDSISGSVDSVTALAVQPDGKLVAFGLSHHARPNVLDAPQFALARYGSDGILDRSFGTNGKVLEQERGVGPGRSLILLSDGRLLHTGSVRTETSPPTSDVAVARYLGEPIPVIESVEGGLHSPVRGNDRTPRIVVAGLTPGHTLKLYDENTEAVSRPVSGESMTLNTTEADSDVVLTGDREHVLSVRTASPSGQLSPITPGFAYILDSALASPGLSIDDVEVVEGDSGTTEAVFTARRPQTSSDQVATVNFATADGSAIAGEDYEATSGSLSFYSGETSHTVVVRVSTDSVSEAHEHFFLRLSDADNATLAKSDGRGLIIDDDRYPVVTGTSPGAGPTSGGTKVTITGVRLSGASLVHFGSAEASAITVVSDKEITAVAPPQPQGVVDVVVTDTSGSSDASFGATFNYGSGTWRQTNQNMVVAREHHTATSLDGPDCRTEKPPAYCGEVLIVGGASARLATPDVTAELYDPTTGTFRPTTSPRLRRYRHSATLLDGSACHEDDPPAYCGQVLVVGEGRNIGGTESGAHGKSVAQMLGYAELYDPDTEAWLPAGTMIDARFDHTATLIEGPNCAPHCGKVLMVGGTVHYYGHPPLASAELYDPLTNSWAPTGSLDACTPADLCRGRSKHTATLLPSGNVLVVAGLGEKLRSQPIPPLDRSLSGIGGDFPDPEPLNSALVYDPAAGSWTPVPEKLPIARFSHTATLLSGSGCASAVGRGLCGKVLVAGGIVGKRPRPGDRAVGCDAGCLAVFTPDTLLYDPSSRRFEHGPIMRFARGGHTATLLDDSTVVVAGSNTTIDNDPRNPTESAEILNLATGAWTTTDSTRAPRGLHTATRLQGPLCRAGVAARWCGSVMIAGGSTKGEEQIPDDTAEVYTPAPRINSMTPATARATGGSDIVIEGWWLSQGVSEVTFGGVPATSFSVESGGRIRAMAPPHVPGPVEVAVVNGGGTSAAMVPEPASRFVYAGAPGAITDLVATPLPAAVTLSFTSPDDGTTLAPATRFVVKQSTSPIEGDAGFVEAKALCGGVCSVKAGRTVELAIADLEAETTYYYAVQALSPLDEPGPVARVSTTTLAAVSAGKAATVCGPSVGAGPGQVAYPGGRYSLVGLPPASVLGTNAPLYSWINQGAGGSYSTFAGGVELEAGHGYWAWFACDGLATLGAGQSSATMPLGAYHASMVGNPSATGPAMVSGHDFAARWDPHANAGAGGYTISGYREAQGLALGEATWVFAYVATTVAVNASP